MHPTAIPAEPALPPAASPVMAQSRVPGWLITALLVLVTLVLYWPATRLGYATGDDETYVTANAHVQGGLTWENVEWACFNEVCSNWHPATVWSHMAVCQVSGLNPWGHHVANVVLHALNAGLVFVLLRQLTGATWRSLFVAALFAFHPLRVEAAAWVSERKGVLSGFFGLLALIAYARYAKSRASNQWSVISSQSSGPSPADRPRAVARRSLITDHRLFFYFLSLLLFALGLMSKPMLVTWPCVMLLLDYWPLQRFDLDSLRPQLPTIFRLVMEKIPFFVLASLESVATFVVQRQGGAMLMGQSLPLSARLGNALVSYCRYLGKLFWPTDLIIYPHPVHWPLGNVLLAGALILGVFMVVWVQRRRASYLLVGWLWYCGTLVPASQVIQVGIAPMADRWTYIPLLGVIVLTVWSVCELTRGWRYRGPGLSVAGGAAVLLCMALTWHQIPFWKDNEALARHGLDVPETRYGAHTYFGTVSLKAGQLDKAIEEFQEALLLRPINANAHYNLGIALQRQGRLDQAIGHFQGAILLERDNPRAHRDLVVSFYQEGRTGDAIRDLHADLHYSLGTALYQQGRIAEAVSQFQETLRLRPGHAEAHNNLGAVLGKQGRTEEAIGHFREAIRLKPDYAAARRNLEAMLASKAPPWRSRVSLPTAELVDPDKTELPLCASPWRVRAGE